MMAAGMLALGQTAGLSQTIIIYGWTGNTSVDANWSNPANWNPAAVPGGGTDDGIALNAGSSAANPVNYNTGTLTVLARAANLGNGASDAGFLAVNSGTLNFSAQAFNVGNSGTGVLTINNGGTVIKDAGVMNVGNAAGSQGTITVNSGGTLTFRNLNQGSYAIGGAGTGRLNVHGGAVNFAASGARNFVVGGSTGTGVVDLRGGTISAAASAGAISLSIGYASGDEGTGNGSLNGYGSVSMIGSGGTGNLRIGGQVTADGTQLNSTVADHTLSFTYNNLVTADNTPGATHFGWYTQNQGAIDLRAVSIGGGGNAFWGDDQTNVNQWTPGTASNALVNSARLHFTAGSGTVDVTLLDPTRDTAANGTTPLLDAPAGVEFLNIWQLDVSGGANAVDLFAVRYDESFGVNAADNFGALAGFYYWDGVSGSWIDLTGSTTIDTTNFIASFSGAAQSIANGGSGFFALAAVPEPSAAGLLAAAALALAARRRKGMASGRPGRGKGGHLNSNGGGPVGWEKHP